MLPRGDPKVTLASTVRSPKVMFFLQQYFFLFFCSRSEFLQQKMPPAAALVCFTGSWQKWWVPWTLFWAGLDRGATHTAESTHYTWKHPGLWAHTHTHTVTAMWHCGSKLSLWDVLTAAIQRRSWKAPPPQMCPPLLLDWFCWHTHVGRRTLTHTWQLFTSRRDEC